MQRWPVRFLSFVEPFGCPPFFRWSIWFWIVNVIFSEARSTVPNSRCSSDRSITSEPGSSLPRSIRAAILLLMKCRVIQGHNVRWLSTIFCTNLCGVFPSCSFRISKIDWTIWSKTTFRAILTAFFSFLSVSADLRFLLDGVFEMKRWRGSFRFGDDLLICFVGMTITIPNVT